MTVIKHPLVSGESAKPEKHEREQEPVSVCEGPLN